MNIRRRIFIFIPVLTIIATVVDLVVLGNNLAFTGYHYIGWTLAWLSCFGYIRNFISSVGCTILIALFEDVLFLWYEALLGNRLWYPLYCHTWIPDAYGSWAKFLSYNWLGMPSYYYIGGVAGVVMLFVGLRYLRRNSSDKGIYKNIAQNAVG
ncbi:hypothetical protein ACFLW0_01745 [Chloroflexota bacterium]